MIYWGCLIWTREEIRLTNKWLVMMIINCSRCIMITAYSQWMIIIPEYRYHWLYNSGICWQALQKMVTRSQKWYTAGNGWNRKQFIHIYIYIYIYMYIFISIHTYLLLTVSQRKIYSRSPRPMFFPGFLRLVLFPDFCLSHMGTWVSPKV